ncbi:MAG: hypothetical protein EOP06_01250 [Proteobacteria bacterium]|nr:MAG: hypothetical protein EOP06_01250 [Pseudomonadota bacterium]
MFWKFLPRTDSTYSYVRGGSEMEPKESVDKANENVSKEGQSTFVTNEEFERARRNSRVGAIVAIAAAMLLLVSNFVTQYISKVYNEVAVIPSSERWEYPMVDWLYVSSPFEENPKIASVALKYVNALYEIDYTDYSRIQLGGEATMVSTKIADIMAYILPDSREKLKAAYLFKMSQVNFKEFSECRCHLKFLIEEMRITDVPGYPLKRVEMIGTYYKNGQDGMRPVPASYDGYKKVTVLMVSDISLSSRFNSNEKVFDVKDKETIDDSKLSDNEKAKRRDLDDMYAEAGISEVAGKTAKEVLLNGGVVSRNPEGWYILRSQLVDLNARDYQAEMLMRYERGLKEVE